MSIPVHALAAVVSAGHPDHALVGLPISLVREILAALPVAVLGFDAGAGDRVVTSWVDVKGVHFHASQEGAAA